MRIHRTSRATRNVAFILSILATTMISSSPGAGAALAQAASVFQVTLGEPNQKTTEMSTDELRQVLRDGSSLVFDSRPHMEYAVSHIPGALNVAPKPGTAVLQWSVLRHEHAPR